MNFFIFISEENFPLLNLNIKFKLFKIFKKFNIKLFIELKKNLKRTMKN